MLKYILGAFIVTSFYSFSQSFSVYDTEFLGEEFGDIELVDVNRDGDLDLILTGSNGEIGYTRVYSNSGSGSFYVTQSSDLPYIDFSSVAVGDIDGDNDIDLFICGHIGQYNGLSAIYKNVNGVFQLHNDNLIGVYEGDCEFIDVENDGDLDLIYFGATGFGVETTVLYLNDGQGNFTKSQHVFPPNKSGFIDVGDANLDGFSDFILLGESNGVNSRTILFLNKQDGTFEASSQQLQGISFGEARFMDIEPDGDDDIVLCGLLNMASIYHSKVYINNGAGEFTDVGNRGLDSLRGSTLSIADLDWDGDLDVFLSGKDKQNVKKCNVYFNENGYFVKDSTFKEYGLHNGNSVIGNLNQDCSPDIIYTGFGDSCQNDMFIYFNNIPNVNDCFEEIPDTTDTTNNMYKFKIFSNPIEDNLRIEGNKKIVNYIVYNSLGKAIARNNYDSEILEMDFKSYTNGMYHIKFMVENDDTIYIEKIIKN